MKSSLILVEQVSSSKTWMHLHNRKQPKEAEDYKKTLASLMALTP